MLSKSCSHNMLSISRKTTKLAKSIPTKKKTDKKQHKCRSLRSESSRQKLLLIVVKGDI